MKAEIFCFSNSKNALFSSACKMRLEKKLNFNLIFFCHNRLFWKFITSKNKFFEQFWNFLVLQMFFHMIKKTKIVFASKKFVFKNICFSKKKTRTNFLKIKSRIWIGKTTLLHKQITSSAQLLLIIIAHFYVIAVIIWFEELLVKKWIIL